MLVLQIVMCLKNHRNSKRPSKRWIPMIVWLLVIRVWRLKGRIIFRIHLKMGKFNKGFRLRSNSIKILKLSSSTFQNQFSTKSNRNKPKSLNPSIAIRVFHHFLQRLALLQVTKHQNSPFKLYKITLSLLKPPKWMPLVKSQVYY